MLTGLQPGFTPTAASTSNPICMPVGYMLHACRLHCAQVARLTTKTYHCGGGCLSDTAGCMTACLQTWLGVLPLAYKHTSVGGSARPCESNRLFRPANELPTSRYVCPRFCKGFATSICCHQAGTRTLLSASSSSVVTRCVRSKPWR